MANASESYRTTGTFASVNQSELNIFVGSVIGPGQTDWFTGAFLPGFEEWEVRMRLEWHKMETGEMPTAIKLDIGTCYGGNVREAMAIVTYLRSLEIPIAVNVRSLAASAATFLMCAADRGQITASEVAAVMFHKPGGCVDGNADTLRATADYFDVEEAGMLALYVGRFGKTPDEWRAILTGPPGADGTWYTAADALASGIVDSVTPLHLADPTQATLAAEGATARLTRLQTAVARVRPASLAPSPTEPMPKPATPAAASAAKPSPMAAFLNGIISGAKALLTDEPAADATPATAVATASELADGAGSIYYDGTLEVGTVVYSDEAMATQAAAGDYVLADGRTATVDDTATVTAIADAVAAAAPAPDAAAVAVQIADAVALATAPIQSQLAAARARADKAEAKLGKVVPGAGDPTRTPGGQAFVPAAGSAKSTAGASIGQPATRAR